MFPSTFCVLGDRDTHSVRKFQVVQYCRSLHFGSPPVLFGFKNFFKMASHTGSATPEQIDTLLNFLDEHRDLALGRLRGGDGNSQSKRLWEELCNMLNSMGGCTKTIQQWQKVWADRKHLAKEAAADARRSALATGGGPSTAPQLSQWQLKILAIMGDGFGGRQTGARVQAFSEEPIPSTSSQTSQPLSLPQPDLNDEVQEYVQPSQKDRQLSQAMSPPPVAQSLTFTPSSQRARRRRQSALGSNVSSRLYYYEERRAEREIIRNNALVGIRTALLQLCDLLREYLDHRN